jgi:Tol biopolymer transport system component
MPAERLSTVRPLGLHIVDLAAGRDIHIRPDAYSRLGCMGPEAVAWSPDARALAYDCFEEHRVIEVMRRDGTGPRPVQTRLWESLSPTWSPDGKRLAFAGLAVEPVLPPGPEGFAIYVIRLDGTRRVLVTHYGAAPSWSPDGKTIAYETEYGIRLVTPDGVDVTPNGLALAPAGIPSWSPDGRTIAIAADDGVYLVGKTGAGLRRMTRLTGAAGLVRPAWYPARDAPRPRKAAHECGPC